MANFIKYRRFLVFLFIFSFLVRAIVFAFYLFPGKKYWQIDSADYVKIAKSITTGKGYRLNSTEPTFHRLPGYPLFLSFFYWLSGENGETIALWFQLILFSLLPVLVFILSLFLFPDSLLLAKASALYAIFHLGFVLYSGFLMSEALFILFFLAATILLFYGTSFVCDDCYGNWIFFFAGLLLGIASLIRAVGHYLIFIFLFFIAFNHYKRKFISLIMIFGGWFIPVSLWLIRNFLLTGFVFFHSLPGGHFLYLSAARVFMHTHNCSYWEARDILHNQAERKIKEKEEVLGRSLNEIERCKILENLALSCFFSSPFLTLRNWILDIFRASFSLYSAELLFLEGGRKTIDYFRKGRGIKEMLLRFLLPDTKYWWLRIIIWLEIIFSIFLWLGFVGSLILLIMHYRFDLLKNWLTCFLFICFFLFIALAGGYARMRLPAEAFLIILSLSFWLCIVRYFLKKGSCLYAKG